MLAGDKCYEENVNQAKEIGSGRVWEASNAILYMVANDDLNEKRLV